eukprot:TRINITY_DN8494_c0_g1_i1.p1 TRINITY_DN8494_c0_g1~~TRINITY_DN8494_c0_g1_i1.p1  ORF type:complete len:233 (-),score=11.04 TRINITY_DN8494_c0_g1_i1:31-729(-)
MKCYFLLFLFWFLLYGLCDETPVLLLPDSWASSTSTENWRYFYFDINSTLLSYHQIQVQLFRTSRIAKDTTFSGYIAYGRIPNQRDKSFGTRVVVSNQSLPSLKYGRFFVGVYSPDIQCTFSIRFCSHYCEAICPNDCSNHGACDASSKICTCDSHWKGQACTDAKSDWILGIPLSLFVLICVGAFVIVCVVPLVFIFVRLTKTSAKERPLYVATQNMSKDPLLHFSNRLSV